MENEKNNEMEEFAEQEEKNEFVDNVELLFFDMKVEVDKDNTAKKVVFVQDNGDKISFKPYTTQTEHQDGFNVEKLVSPTLKELPSILHEIAAELKKNGKAKVKGCYVAWTKYTDGKEQIIRYIRGGMIKKWELL